MSRKPSTATLERAATRTAPESAPTILPAGVTPVISRTYDVFGPPESSKQAVRDRAYQIYLARNGAPGDAQSDWIAAERELREESQRRGRTSWTA